MGSKSPTTQTSQTTSADPAAASDITSSINRARRASNTPYQAYSGPLTAGVNSQEQAGISATNNLGTATTGYLNTAGGLAQASTAAVNPTAVDGAAISQYESPYQSDVVNATMAEINNQNAQQRQGQTSSAISAGAFGGDRAGVAQAALANQQDLASNATLANLNNQNYSQALSEANTQQQTTLAADQANRAALQSGSQLYSGLGSLASSTGIANAQAQMEGGLLEQQTQQASDTANYGQFENQQAYPFQTAQFLAGITGSLAPSLGTSSSGTSVSSPPNPLSSILGAGLGVGSFFLPKAKGGAVLDLGSARYARGGRTLGDLSDEGDLTYAGLGQVRRYATGGFTGMPYADAAGYVPTVGLAAARMPSGMSVSQPQSTGAAPSMTNLTAGLGMAGRNFMNSNAGDSVSDFAQDTLGFARGGVAQAAMDKVVDLGLARARRGYDGGGVVSDPNAMLFDPTAFGDPSALGAMQPGLSAAAMPNTMTPAAGPPSPGLAAASMAPVPVGLAAADTSSPVPVAPAPTVTPVIGYKNADGSAAPAPGLAAADMSGSSAASSGVAAAAMPPASAPPSSPGVAAAALPGSPPASPGLSAAAAPDASSAIDAATAPRSVRNNNPGNIEDGKYAQGLPGYAGSDGRFARFETPEAGTAAMDGLLNRYGQQGLTTPLQIISKWAPAGDGANNPMAYASTVAKALGIGVNDPIDMNNPTQRAALGKAMASVEGGTGGTGGGISNGALGYAGGDNGGGLGAGGNGGSSSPGLAAAVSSGLGSAASTSNGVLDAVAPGGLHFSDQQRLGVLAAGLGMMASPSRSVGQALGQGGLQGLQTYQGQQKMALDQRAIALKAQELSANLLRIAQEGKNYESEAAYRKVEGGARQQDATATTNRVNLERFQLIPGPDGDFRYFDKLNPGAGLITSAQIGVGSGTLGGAPIPNSAPVTSIDGGGGAPAPNSGVRAPVALGASPAPNAGTSPPAKTSGPLQLDSSNFTRTGNPTLRAPQGYLPTNYYENQLRAQNDPVVRETMAKQTADDVTEANKRATKAYSGMFYSDEMDKAISGLPQTGVLAPGGFFNERLNIAKNWNAFAGAIPGMGDMQVDPDAVGRGESLIKDKTRLTGDLTSTLGSREAASVYSSMMSAVPGGDNSRHGYKAVSSAIRSLSQREIDHNAFMQDYVGRYGNTNGAEVAFNQLNPAMVYAQQAASLARVPQQASDLLRSNSNNPRIIAAFESKYGSGTARYFTGQAAQ